MMNAYNKIEKLVVTYHKVRVTEKYHNSLSSFDRGTVKSKDTHKH